MEEGELVVKILGWLMLMGLLGAVMWILVGEGMKDKACPDGHCTKNGRFQCE